MFEMLFSILGSLGLFLFGVKLMNEGIQKVAGEGLRNIIQRLTHKRAYGVIAGTLVTITVQSSSATTVMIVSFVNVGLMKLREAIGAIMGANLGTTATFWIVAFIGFKFSLSSIALPCIGIGMVLYFLKSTKAQETGQAVIGFGLLFLGLQFLKKSVPDIKSNPEIFEFIQNYTDMGFTSILLFLVFGIILTVVVQSSSVAGTITLTMAFKGWIGYEVAAAIILGENIGTTVTALIASMGANRNAKRAALAHLFFNVFGVVWMLIIFYPFLQMVDNIMPGSSTVVAGSSMHSALPEHLALFHTLFNLCNILLVIWFVPQLESLVNVMLPQRENEATSDEKLLYITNRLTETGELNILEGQKQVGRLAEIAEEMFDGFLDLYQNPGEDRTQDVKRLKALERKSDELDSSIAHYFVQCSTRELSVSSANLVAALLSVSSELEEICDHCYRLVLLARRKYRKDLNVTPEMQQSIKLYSRQVLQFIQFVQQCLKRDVSLADMETALGLKTSIRSSRKSLQKAIIMKMENAGDIKSGLISLDIVNHFQKIGNHSLNILEQLQSAKTR